MRVGDWIEQRLAGRIQLQLPLVEGGQLARRCLEGVGPDLTTLSKRFKLIGVQGIVRMAMAAFDTACWDALAIAAPENTMVSRIFSGRAGRSIATDYARAATAPGTLAFRRVRTSRRR